MNKKGFTLIEILVVISLLGVLASLIFNSFFSSLIKGRDSRRKQDLQQINNALELYYAEHNIYPTGSSSNPLPWGEALKKKSSDTKFYMRKLPDDPIANQFNYVYQSNGTYFKIYSCLENNEDLNYNNITPTPPAPDCGNGCENECHYGIASPNQRP